MRLRYWLAIISLLAVGAGAVTLQPPQISQAAIEYSVIRSPQFLERAWKLPVAATFKRHVDWQSNASLCGPASLANTLRSLGEANRTEEKVLEDTGFCWTGFCIIGLSLDELAELARHKTMRRVTVLRGLTQEEFREHLRHTNDPHRRYIINFTRKMIFGEGVGHHSPVGGYLEKEDLVLVLDVNRKFRPWLVESSRLYSAMNTSDGSKKRGLLLIE